MLVFAIINSVPRGTGATREWRNRQTRTFEGRVVIPYGFKSRLSHQEDSFIGILFLLRRSTHFEPSSAAPPCKNKEHIYAGMAELADALDSGSNGRKAVQVQVLLPAPEKSTSSEVLFSMKHTLRRMKNEAALRPMKRGFAARKGTGASLHASAASASRKPSGFCFTFADGKRFITV